MATYTLTCSGTVCGGANVLGVLELPDDHPAPDQAAWGHLCDTCAAAWHQAIADDAATAARDHRPPAPARALLPLGPPAHPHPHPAPPVLPTLPTR